MEEQKILKQRNKQLTDKISQLLHKKDKLYQATAYQLLHQHTHFVNQVINQSLKALGKQPIHKIHNHHANSTKHNHHIDYHKLDKSNPINIRHYIKTNMSNTGTGNRSKYNHLYYLKHRKHIIKRAKIRRDKKRAKLQQASLKDHKNTILKDKIKNNIAFKANINGTSKVNWRNQNDPF